ncbi:MAG: lytic transglycosylase domain-containing protein [Elusimicrobia bacterium]|nr:lytic transglycosylase domain-containing protein [Elusimicrobiota bacterium]
MAVLAELYPGLRSVFIALPGKEPAPLPQGQSALSGRGGSVERLKARLGDVSDASSLNRLFDNAGRTRAEFSPAPPAPAPVVADPISAARSRFAEVEKLLRGRGASQRVIDLTINEAVRQKADPLLVLAMVQAESNFRTRAVSSCGARGLMQLIPSTAKDMGVDDPDALFDPRVNLRAGVRYLKWLWGRFATLSFSDLIKADLSGSASAQKAVAAYNAGPGNVRKYGGIPPFKETRNYVAKIVRTYKELRQAFLSAV